MGLAIVDKLGSMMGYPLVHESSTESPHPFHCPTNIPCPFPGIVPAPILIQNLDCIIVLDNSGSIGQTEFNQAKEAAKV